MASRAFYTSLYFDCYENQRCGFPKTDLVNNEVADTKKLRASVAGERIVLYINHHGKKIITIQEVSILSVIDATSLELSLIAVSPRWRTTPQSLHGRRIAIRAIQLSQQCLMWHNVDSSKARLGYSRSATGNSKKFLRHLLSVYGEEIEAYFQALLKEDAGV
jgi:hypothetical protein